MSKYITGIHFGIHKNILWEPLFYGNRCIYGDRPRYTFLPLSVYSTTYEGLVCWHFLRRNILCISCSTWDTILATIWEWSFRRRMCWFVFYISTNSNIPFGRRSFVWYHSLFLMIHLITMPIRLMRKSGSSHFNNLSTLSSNAYPGVHQRSHQSFVLPFVLGIIQEPGIFSLKLSMRNICPYHDVIVIYVVRNDFV